MSNKRKRSKYNHKSTNHKGFRKTKPEKEKRMRFVDRINEIADADIKTPDNKWEKIFTYVIYVFLMIGAPVIGCAFGIFMYARARDIDSETKNYGFIGKLSIVLLVLYVILVIAIYVMSWFGLVEINL